MHSKNCILILSFLSINLLTLVAAFPHPQGLPSGVTGSTSFRGSIPKIVPKPPKHHDGEDPEVGDSNPFESDNSEGTGSESESGGDSGHDSDDGSSSCPASNPLPLQFTQQLPDGHGCKIVAQAFDTCSSADNEFFCREENYQVRCLCNGHPKLDQHLEDCSSFLAGQGRGQVVQGLKGYRGVCAA